MRLQSLYLICRIRRQPQLIIRPMANGRVVRMAGNAVSRPALAGVAPEWRTQSAQWLALHPPETKLHPHNPENGAAQCPKCGKHTPIQFSELCPHPLATSRQCPAHHVWRTTPQPAYHSAPARTEQRRRRDKFRRRGGQKWQATAGFHPRLYLVCLR